MMGRPQSREASKMVSFRVAERLFHDQLRDRPNRTAFITEAIRMKAHAELITRDLNEIHAYISEILEEDEMAEDSRMLLEQCIKILDRIGSTYGI